MLRLRIARRGVTEKWLSQRGHNGTARVLPADSHWMKVRSFAKNIFGSARPAARSTNLGPTRFAPCNRERATTDVVGLASRGLPLGFAPVSATTPEALALQDEFAKTLAPPKVCDGSGTDGASTDACAACGGNANNWREGCASQSGIEESLARWCTAQPVRYLRRPRGMKRDGGWLSIALPRERNDNG